MAPHAAPDISAYMDYVQRRAHPEAELDRMGEELRRLENELAAAKGYIERADAERQREADLLAADLLYDAAIQRRKAAKERYDAERQREAQRLGVAECDAAAQQRNAEGAAAEMRRMAGLLEEAQCNAAAQQHKAHEEGAAAERLRMAGLLEEAQCNAAAQQSNAERAAAEMRRMAGLLEEAQCNAAAQQHKAHEEGAAAGMHYYMAHEHAAPARRDHGSVLCHGYTKESAYTERCHHWVKSGQFCGQHIEQGHGGIPRTPDQRHTSAPRPTYYDTPSPSSHEACTRQCQGTTQTGAQCTRKLRSATDGKYCWQHA